MFLAAFAASSCDDKTKEEIADVIVLSRNSVAFAPEGGTTTVSVATPSPWNASCPDSWVTLQPEVGFLTISLDGNATDDVRNSKITVHTASDEKEISVNQAFSREKVILSTTASNEITFDSEGESFHFSVVTNGAWSVTSDAPWITLDSDPLTGIVRVGAPRNTGAHRKAVLTVQAVKGTSKTSCEVAVSQISREENSYFKFLGYYGLYAENWYYGNDPIGVSGTGSFCTIEQKEYRKSFYIKDLFIKGTVVEASYDKASETMTLNLGRLCQTVAVSPTVDRYHYLVAINVETRSFTPGSLSGTLGEGYNDDADQMRKAILLSGQPAAYPSLGIVAMQEQQYMFFADLYYATGTMYFVEWDREAKATNVTRAAVDGNAAGKFYSVTKN